MKVSGFRTQALSIPRDSGGPTGAATANFVTLTLETSDGIEGIGYAGFFSTLMTQAMKAAVDAVAEKTVGTDPLMGEMTTRRLLAMAGGGEPSGGKVSGAPAGLVSNAVAAIRHRPLGHQGHRRPACRSTSSLAGIVTGCPPMPAGISGATMT